MTAKESKAVAWQWHTGGPQFCTPEDKAKRLAAGDGFAKGYTIPLVPESALQAAEAELADAESHIDTLACHNIELQAELGELRRRVGEYANDMERRVGVSSSATACITRIHANNLRKLLASDGGADGDDNHTNEESK